MAISATALESRIKNALNNYNNGKYKNERENPQHLKVLGDTMRDYFEEKIEVTYTWVAALPPPVSTPDPVVSFKSTVSFQLGVDLRPSRNLDQLALFIQNAFINATIDHASGFSVTPGTFLVTAPPILGRAASIEAAESAILTCICIPVCKWVLTLINPAPLSGTHTAFVGATAGMVIA